LTLTFTKKDTKKLETSFLFLKHLQCLLDTAQPQIQEAFYLSINKKLAHMLLKLE